MPDHMDDIVRKFNAEQRAKRMQPMPLAEAARLAAVTIECADPDGLTVAINPQAIATLLRELGFNANIGSHFLTKRTYEEKSSGYELRTKKRLEYDPPMKQQLDEIGDLTRMEEIVKRFQPVDAINSVYGAMGGQTPSRTDEGDDPIDDGPHVNYEA